MLNQFNKSQSYTGDEMNRKLVLIGVVVLLTGYTSAWSQEDEENAEATIRLMGAAEAVLPDAITKEIALPESVVVDSAAVDSAAAELTTANENRLRREDGLATADEAREKGADMADDAMENRESRGRSADRPDVPEPPTPPGPPGNQ